MTLLHVQQQIPDTGIRLLAGRDNLVRWQDKAIRAGITKLGRKSVVSADNVIGPVDAASCCLVDGRADGAVVEGSAVHSLDGGDGALGESLQLGVLGGSGGAGITIRCTCQYLGCLVSEKGTYVS